MTGEKIAFGILQYDILKQLFIFQNTQTIEFS